MAKKASTATHEPGKNSAAEEKNLWNGAKHELDQSNVNDFTARGLETVDPASGSRRPGVARLFSTNQDCAQGSRAL